RDAKEQQRLKIPSETAEHRAQGEQRQADQKEALAASDRARKLLAVRTIALETTRTVGTTDMPGPSDTSVGGLSMMTLTGTRWTILTKLPVAFCAGSSENAVPDPGCTLATCPRIRRSG